jgi:N6-adenosine-specific RNA methylase IME4
MTQLIRYEQARSALAEARSVDEVKDIRDKAEAMRAYARMANDTQLEMDATELRLRAERRLGIMLADQKATVGFNKGAASGGSKDGSRGSFTEPRDTRPTLADVGVDKKLSARSQKIGGIGERAFEAMVDSMRQRIADGGRVSLDVSSVDKKERRVERERELAAKQAALPDKRYGVIYADPEWRFEVYSRDTGMDRAADNHYPTSGTDAICARPVADIAADDCALFLWATVPMLPDALRVMAAWGFEYKSHCIWAKDRIGTGYWFRNQHELLLVGTRGSIPAPAMGTQVASLVDAPVGKHSEKPIQFYDLIESYFPNLPKIELNARVSRPGWDAWGYEAPSEAAE